MKIMYIFSGYYRHLFSYGENAEPYFGPINFGASIEASRLHYSSRAYYSDFQPPMGIPQIWHINT